MDKQLGRELVEIKNQIAKEFSRSEWLELGFLTGYSEVIEKHHRLLRSLDFGDPDYEGHVLSVLSDMVNKDPRNLEEIKKYIASKYGVPEVSTFISTAHKEVPKRLISFSPQVFSIPDKPQNERLVAVMLPFKQVRAFTAIKNVCDQQKLDCMKADDIWENATFIQDIFDLIFTARVIVADFTGKNPNVFYEVGVAHTLGKTVIPITQSIEHVPSDLGHHRALVYLPNDQGYIDLEKELSKRLKTLFPGTDNFWDELS